MYVVEKRDCRTLPTSACKWGRRMQSRPQCASIGSVRNIYPVVEILFTNFFPNARAKLSS